MIGGNVRVSQQVMAIPPVLVPAPPEFIIAAEPTHRSVRRAATHATRLIARLAICLTPTLPAAGSSGGGAHLRGTDYARSLDSADQVPPDCRPAAAVAGAHHRQTSPSECWNAGSSGTFVRGDGPHHPGRGSGQKQLPELNPRIFWPSTRSSIRMVRPKTAPQLLLSGCVTVQRRDRSSSNRLLAATRSRVSNPSVNRL